MKITLQYLLLTTSLPKMLPYGEINDFAFYPGDGEEISVYFYKNPPKNIFGAGSESPSFCEFQGKINIYKDKEFSSPYNFLTILFMIMYTSCLK